MLYYQHKFTTNEISHRRFRNLLLYLILMQVYIELSNSYVIVLFVF